MFRLVTAAALLLSVARPATAQIYSWRNADGVLVLSNKPQGGSSTPAASYTVAKSEAIRTTRPAQTRDAGRYDDVIQEHATLNGVRTDLVRAVIQVESGFNPAARSPKGALGLMQLMPATIRQFGVSNPFSPKENVRAGVAYLRQLLDRYSGNEQLALAAYNAGPVAVDRHGESIPPFRETEQYVSAVSSLAGQATLRPTPGTQIYQSVQIVNGQATPIFSNRPGVAATPPAPPTADPDGRTLEQVLQSSPIFQAR
jgi:soluble lytic murein transglycosylase-like protein